MFDALKPAAEALKPGLSKVIDGDLQRLARYRQGGAAAPAPTTTRSTA